MAFVPSDCKVSEPAWFGAAPAPGIFFIRSRLPVKDYIISEFMKTDYERIV